MFIDVIQDCCVHRIVITLPSIVCSFVNEEEPV